MDNRKVAIIGGGISGLCLGYWLKKAGLDIRLFERNAFTGGAIQTERTNGFLIDYGPNSILETSEALTELVTELGLNDQKVYGNEASNKRYIVKNGNLHQVPMSPGLFLKTPLFSLSAKIRLLKEPFIKPTSGEDISLAEFVKYRLGNEFLDYAINPFVAGVYAGDPAKLSTAAAFPKLYALEQNYGSLIKGAIKGARERKKRKEVAKDRAKLFSFIDGLDTLPRELTARLKDEVALNTEIQNIEKINEKFRLTITKDDRTEKEDFDQVVMAVPAEQMINLLGIIAPDLKGPLTEVYYPPVAVVFTGFKTSDIDRKLDGFGYLIPEVEKREILGSIWSSTIFPNRAPEGYSAFTSFVGGTRQPHNAELPDDEIKNVVLRELKDLVGLKADPVIVRIRKWPRAIPQYHVGYGKIQEMFDRLEEDNPGLFVAGNIRKGISVGDSVLWAYETGKKILNSIND